MNWTRERILAEVRRLANNGEAPGQMLLEKHVPERAWRGRFWARYSELVQEAGFEPRTRNLPNDPDMLFSAFVPIIRRLGRWPTEPEQQLERKATGTFPSVRVMRTRFGSQAQQIEKVLDLCASRPDLADVEDILRAVGTAAAAKSASQGVAGVVYLIRSGKHYKIGRTNALGRRGYEIGLQLPERHKVVHHIETDDPAGIEAYWHRRFADKRGNGEWFTLSAEDVAAFKRRKRFM